MLRRLPCQTGTDFFTRCQFFVVVVVVVVLNIPELLGNMMESYSCETLRMTMQC